MRGCARTVALIDVSKYEPTIRLAIQELIRRSQELDDAFLRTDAAGMRTTAHELRTLADLLKLDLDPESS